MPSQIMTEDDVPDQRYTGWSWLLPAGTFVAGCALGAVVMGVGDVGRDDDLGSSGAPAAVAGAEAGEGDEAAGAEITGDGTPDAGTAASPVQIRVPESCAQTADDATALVEQVDDLVAAVANLDPERLRQAVDDAQQVRDEVQEVAEQCQEAAARSQVEMTDGEGDAQSDAAEPTTPAS